MVETNHSASDSEITGQIPLDLDLILTTIEPKWDNDFKEFIETGDASREFLKYVDSSRECQEALELVFEHEIGNIKRALTKTCKQTDLARQLMATTKRLATDPEVEVQAAVSAAVSSIASDPQSRERLSNVLDDFVKKTRSALSDIETIESKKH